jgi:hypothetical protein
VASGAATRYRLEMRRRRMALRLLASLGLFLVALEVVFRLIRPSPRFQVVRPRADQVLRNRAGVPVWNAPESEARQNEACEKEHPRALPLVFLGSSIFFGAGVRASEAFPSLIQTKLDGLYPGAVCVHNYAEPGYSASNKLATAKEVLPELKGAIVVWEVWGNDPFPYVFLGDSAFALRSARVDSAGYPDAFGLPRSMNQLLFRHSRAYEYASLAFVPMLPEPEWSVLIKTRVLPVMDEVDAMVKAQHASLIVLLAPRLDRPFALQIDGADDREIREWSQSHAEFHEIAALLKDQDPAAIRLDPCCHYNPLGHRVLAERLLGLLSTRIAQRLGTIEE